MAAFAFSYAVMFRFLVAQGSIFEASHLHQVKLLVGFARKKITLRMIWVENAMKTGYSTPMMRC